MKLIIGSRASNLAMWQTEYVKAKLEGIYSDIEIEIKQISTKGDRILDVALQKIEGKGLFTKEIEIAMLNGEIDFAVHSLKDLPTVLPDGLEISAYIIRHNPEDVIISKTKGLTINALPRNAKIATGSLRRRAQVLHQRPDIQISDLRGNINTRIKKYIESDWEAIILARAGVERIGFDDMISRVLPIYEMIPAVGQGALAVESRSSDNEIKKILSRINHRETELAVRCERAYLDALGGGCSTPIGAYAKLIDNKLEIKAMAASPDGQKYYKNSLTGPMENPEELGKAIANIILQNGAKDIIEL